ncbi:hypothetical protein EK21DRAFT_55409 [Setomelanomma holmii]|uniref:Uncharacterized protein n=1 Tax=Setomelanomma holmii TaxID=210430 RepID=A0A9P4LS28_9PLEO|nr:hypothetical protein EK21DRAFT_55409 [Setomelanomma holmii]
MGNLCGKQSKDNFEGQGRTLDSAPAPATKASVPPNVASAPKIKVGGPDRTLGPSNAVDDARVAAAAAAEARNNKVPTGDLQQRLVREKRLKRDEWLQQAANDTQRARAADQAKEIQNYN